MLDQEEAATCITVAASTKCTDCYQAETTGVHYRINNIINTKNFHCNIWWACHQLYLLSLGTEVRNQQKCVVFCWRRACLPYSMQLIGLKQQRPPHYICSFAVCTYKWFNKAVVKEFLAENRDVPNQLSTSNFQWMIHRSGVRSFRLGEACSE